MAMVVFVVAGALLPAQPAVAGGTIRTNADCDATSCTSYAANERDSWTWRRPSGRRRRSPVACTFSAADIAPDAVVYRPDGSQIPADGTGRWFEKRCEVWEPETDALSTFVYRGDIRRRETVDLVYLRTRAADVVSLKDEAFGSLPLPTPEVVLSPPPDKVVVNFPTWLAVNDPWRPRTSAISVPGVSVVVTAYPIEVRYDMGNGDVVTCQGPGKKYDPAVGGGAPRTDCSYTYRVTSVGRPATAETPGDRYLVRATVDWHVTWSAVGAPGGGDLGTVSRTSDPVAVAVGEIQTFNVDGSEGSR
jgi:hypothetical protein